MRTKLVFAAMLALAVAGCGDDGGDGAGATDAPASRLETRTVTFGAGQFLEAQLMMSEGDTSILRLASSDGDITWNVHGHSGGGSTTYDEGVAASVEETFEAPSTDKFWYLIGNGNASGSVTVDIEIELFGDAVLEEWLD